MEFFYFLALSFTISSLILSSIIFLLRLKRYCGCDTCRTFMSGRWSMKYHNLCDWYTHLLEESPTATINVHLLNNVITANPKNVEYMLKTNFDNYPKGKPFSAILGDLLGHGIFNVDGEKWKFQRKMATLELGSLSIRSYALETVAFEITDRLVPLLSSVCKREGVVDLQDVFRRFSFDIICKISFGIDLGYLDLSLPISEFVESFDLATTLSAQRAMTASPAVWKVKRLLNLGPEKKLGEAIKKINVLAEQIIRQKRQMGFSTQNDLLSRFMGSTNNDRYLRDIVISFLLAGRDTVASALTSFFWLMEQHPNVVTSIRDELARVLGQDEKLASFDQMRELHYLQATLYESMRLCPPVQFDSKFCQKNDMLPDGTFVRKGTRVTYHPYAMGRMTSIWGSDCLEFKPERWLENGSFQAKNPYEYPVFQAGLRVCLGKELALMEMKSVAIAFIRKFDIQAVAKSSTMKFAPGLTATMKGGFPVTIRGIAF